MPAEHVMQDEVNVPGGGKIMIAELCQVSSQIGLVADQKFRSALHEESFEDNTCGAGTDRALLYSLLHWHWHWRYSGLADQSRQHDTPLLGSIRPLTYQTCTDFAMKRAQGMLKADEAEQRWMTDRPRCPPRAACPPGGGRSCGRSAGTTAWLLPLTAPWLASPCRRRGPQSLCGSSETPCLGLHHVQHMQA